MIRITLVLAFLLTAAGCGSDRTYNTTNNIAGPHFHPVHPDSTGQDSTGQGGD